MDSNIRHVLFWLLLTTTLVTIVDKRASADEPAQKEVSDAEGFLENLQARTFAYFWETANAENGLVPDRWPAASPSSIAGVGFELTACCIGAERGYVTRDQAIDRVRTTLRFFWQAPQSEDPDVTAGYRGFYYHFLDMQSGLRFRRCELSSIDTALLMGGVLACREYFDQDDSREREIRELADALFRRVEWNWMQPRPPLIVMAWEPKTGFGKHDYRGYNETMLLYVLALGSPTHAIDDSVWDTYTSTYLWAEFYGQEHINFTPLFGHQFSHAWIDFRGIQDSYTRAKGIDYFENSRRATYSQRAYAVENPNGWRGYGASAWGLTACDGPADHVLPYRGEQRSFHSYRARGASAQYVEDDGTIAPTAVAGSIPFAPEITIPALQAMHNSYGGHLFAKYGFLDSFNPSFTYSDVELTHGKLVEDLGWFDSDYLSIDQGPIILMIENYRSEFVWELMKKCSYLRRGLDRAGFSGGWLEEQP